MFFINLALGFTTVIALALSLLILISNPKKRENQSLFALVFAMFIWLATNLATNLSPTQELAMFFGKSTLIGAALIPYFFWVFVQFYLKKKVTWFKLAMWGIVPLIVLIAMPTSLNIQSIDAYGLNTKTGSIYFLVIVMLLVYFSVGLWQLRVLYRDKQTTAVKRAQLRYIFAGIIAALVPTFLINAVLPVVTGDTLIILYGPNAVIFLAIFTSIAIIKHRLLDIRLIVARSLAYVLLLGSLVAVYAILVVLFTQEIPLPDSLSFVKEAVPFIAAILVALSFGPLKRFFDKYTNRFFYQDAYEAQSLLNDLNSMLVATLDVNTILKNASLLLEHYLKPSVVVFCVYKNEGMPEKVFMTSILDEGNQRKNVELVKKFTEKVTIVDDTESLEPTLHAEAVARNISLAAHLDAPNQSRTVGSIILGPKKSGSMYGTQDYRVMEIIADELVLAIQNALSFDEIQQFNVTLQGKVDRATKELRGANEKLIALDQSKDEFISMASHQLRTPLTSVKGYVSMVLEGDVGKISAQQKKLLDQAYLSSQRMVYLIADLLNVSRLKTGKFIIEAKPTNLADVVEGELEQLKETAGSRKLTLEYTKPKSFPMLELDETKIRQVVMNFVDNAIYYTPAGGHIKVAVEDKGETVDFTVTDDGIGVPKSEQHNLFNKFYRAGNAKKARPDGTGLGLFMAKKVVIAQGGNIIFKTAEGKGSTFGFSFEKKKLASGTRSVEMTEEAADDEPAPAEETPKAKKPAKKT